MEHIFLSFTFYWPIFALIIENNGRNVMSVPHLFFKGLDSFIFGLLEAEQKPCKNSDNLLRRPYGGVMYYMKKHLSLPHIPLISRHAKVKSSRFLNLVQNKLHFTID